MKIANILALIAIAGVSAQGQTNTTLPRRDVTVCMDLSPIPYGAGPYAKQIASKIFSGIGVNIVWLRGLEGCPDHALLIVISQNTPKSLQPRALAYALPFEGTHIYVFLDRILNDYSRGEFPVVLGHIYAHEIAHVLQGLARHSASGVMKANWNILDVGQMMCKPLSFEAQDGEMIHRGLEMRTARMVAAQNHASVAASGSPIASRLTSNSMTPRGLK